MSEVNTTPDGDPQAESAESPADALRSDRSTGDQPESTPEQTLWTDRTNWKHFAGTLIAYGVLSLALVVVTIAWLPDGWGKWVTGAILIAGAVLASKTAITILSTRYTLTSERLFVERGLISQTKDQTELIRVDDVRVRKTLFDRIFDLGNVDVFSTDQSDKATTIEGVAGADGVAELVRNHMRSARKKSLFIENL